MKIFWFLNNLYSRRYFLHSAQQQYNVSRLNFSHWKWLNWQKYLDLATKMDQFIEIVMWAFVDILSINSSYLSNI